MALGCVTWLNYRNPHISPFQEMQKWKTHPEIAKILKGGKRISYGARAISDGGYQSVPKLAFPGGALIGDSAGFLNVPRIKGTHTSMKSGMMAAEAAFAAVNAGRSGDTLTAYQDAYDDSWVKKELGVVRNVLPLVEKFGDLAGTILSGMTMWLESFGIRTVSYTHLDVYKRQDIGQFFERAEGAAVGADILALDIGFQTQRFGGEKAVEGFLIARRGAQARFDKLRLARCDGRA